MASKPYILGRSLTERVLALAQQFSLDAELNEGTDGQFLPHEASTSLPNGAWILIRGSEVRSYLEGYIYVLDEQGNADLKFHVSDLPDEVLERDLRACISSFD